MKPQHVAHVGLAGWKDWNVVRYAGEGDFILVTNNASDFRQLYAVQPLHVGLIILIPAASSSCSVEHLVQGLPHGGGRRSNQPANLPLEIPTQAEATALYNSVT
jgi:hypothetical protein